MEGTSLFKNLIKNKDVWLSHLRSVLKIAGTAIAAFGLAEAEALGPLIDAIVVAVGAVITAVGMFMSVWEHTPDEAPKQ